MSSTRLFVAPAVTDNAGIPKIRRLLIANRGEIACRIIQTCRTLDIISIAVYTEEDAGSAHVEEADEAANIGRAAEGSPHQDIKLLITIAKQREADAIHPGYGYLSENAEFAQAVKSAGLIWVGPSPEAISALGDKRVAKEHLARHAPSIPLIPGYAGKEQSVDVLSQAADTIGYPILIKASAGGGGKGMRIVHEQRHFRDELERARSEAERSFGSSDCILEKYIARGKHIEFQIIGDSSGDIRSLFDRECSIQRRHQKIIEESPSPWLPDDVRERMSQAAVAIGKLIGYESAGTVEFMVDVETKKFYFLEVNTRIQVEHPITEEVTGIDIVAVQLYIAAGGRLDSLQPVRDVRQTGHAIECRLCAEDPERNFMPDLGKVWRWQPSLGEDISGQGERVRFETALRTGSQVSVYFDPMVAKIIVWAPTRAAALRRMASVLDRTVCLGIRTNQAFMKACLSHENFLDVAYSTNFIPENLDSLLGRIDSVINAELALDRLSVGASIFHQACLHKSSASQTFSGIRNGFRIQSSPRTLQGSLWKLRSSQDTSLVVVSDVSARMSHPSDTGPVVSQFGVGRILDGNDGLKGGATPSDAGLPCLNRVFSALRHGRDQSIVEARTVSCKVQVITGTPSWFIGDLSVQIDGRRINMSVAMDASFASTDVGKPQKIFCHAPGLGTFEFHRYSRLAYGESLRKMTVGNATGTTVGVCKAPMPCKVFQIPKKSGENVSKGDVLLIVESMKMEMKILSPGDGVVQYSVEEAQAVDEGTALCEVS